jgi:hypothetical protein
MGIKSKKERTLVDEVMARIAHEPDAIEDPAADELSDDDRRVQCQGESQAGSEVVVGGLGRHHV